MHDIISVTINTFRLAQSTTTYFYRNMRKIIQSYICSTLQNCGWSAYSLPAQLDVEQGLSALTDNLQEAIDKFELEKTFNLHKSIPPWISMDIHLLMRKWVATERISYDRTGSCQLLIEFLGLTEAVEEQS